MLLRYVKVAFPEADFFIPTYYDSVLLGIFWYKYYMMNKSLGQGGDIIIAIIVNIIVHVTLYCDYKTRLTSHVFTESSLHGFHIFTSCLCPTHKQLGESTSCESGLHRSLR